MVSFEEFCERRIAEGIGYKIEENDPRFNSMRYIFEYILNRVDNVERMKQKSDESNGRIPALQVCAEEIQAYADSIGGLWQGERTVPFELTDDVNTILGRMVCYIMEDAGYEKYSERQAPEFDTFFKTAATYVKKRI